MIMMTIITNGNYEDDADDDYDYYDCDDTE